MALFSFPDKRKYFLVYQMGKVGSTAISESLQCKFGKSKVKHTHDHVLAREIIGDRSARNKETIIITGFREPLSRCISAYFQNIDNPQNQYWYVGKPQEVLEKSAEWLIADYKRRQAIHVAEVVAPWLARFQEATGLSISDFEKRGSLWVASSGRVTCYLYKLECLGKFFEDAGPDSHMAGLQLANTNVGREKWYRELYGQFTQGFQLPGADYQSVYRNIDYVNWLYGDEELLRLTGRYLVEEPLTEMAAPN